MFIKGQPPKGENDDYDNDKRLSFFLNFRVFWRLPEVKGVSHFTRWGQLWDHTHEQQFACSPPVSTLLTFPFTSWLHIQWQASPPEKIRSDAAHPVISTPHRLRTSQIPIPKSVSVVVTHHCHHRPALPFRDWHPFTKPVLILPEAISSTFVPRCYAVLYPVLYLNLKVSPTECIWGAKPKLIEKPGGVSLLGGFQIKKERKKDPRSDS